MLYIIRQYKKMFIDFVVSYMVSNGEGFSASTESIELTPVQKGEFMKHKDFILGFNTNVDRKNKVKVHILQNKLNRLGVKGENGEKLKEDKIWGDNTKHALKVAKEILGNFNNEVISVQTEAQKTTQKLSEETQITKPSTKVILKTKGNRIKLESRKEGIDEEREGVDEKRFIELLKKIEIALMKEGRISVPTRVEVSPAHGDESAEYETQYVDITAENYIEKMQGGAGHLWIERLAKKFGYEDNRSLWTKISTGGMFFYGERDSFNARVENVDNLDITNLQSIKNYLFDFDSDGDVDTRIRDALTEVSIDNYVQSTEEIKNIIENLGFGSDLSVLKQLSFRDQFADRIVEAVKMGPVPFVVLTKKGGYQEFMEKFLKKEEAAKAKLEKQIDAVKLEKSVMIDLLKGPTFNKLSKTDKEKTIKEAIAVKKDATIAISMGYIKALGVNIDLRKLTDGIIDGFNVGINDKGEVGVGINKVLLEESIAGYGFNVTSGLTANGVGVNGTVSRELGNQIEDSTFNVTLGAGVGISFEGATYNILSATITNPSVDNVEGINRILTRESKVFDNVMEGLLKGKTEFTDSEIKSWYNKSVLGRSLNEEELQIAKDNIGDLVNKYETLVAPISNDLNREAIIKKLKKAVLENMVNSLYTGAEGLQLTGIGGFIIPGVVGGVFPMLEYNWISHDIEQNTIGDEVASEMTQMSLRDFISKFGKEYIKVNGNELIIKNDSVNFEIPEKGVFAIDNGDGFTTIKADKGFDLNAFVSQRYVANKQVNATFKQFTLVLETNGENQSEIFNKFPKLREKLNNVETGFNFNTRHNIKGELLNPSAELNDRWESLLKLAQLGDKLKNKKYSDGKPGIGQLGKTDLLTIVSNPNLSNTEKEYIISRVSQFLKKSKRCDISTNKLEDVIAEDNRRRKDMEKGTFPYSFKEEAAAYNILLQNGKLGNKSETGLSFDSASTIVGNGSKKGVDVFRGDCDMITVDGKIIKVEIKDPTKIKDLKERAKAAGVTDVDNLVFNFYKDPHGFDDRVMVGRKPGTGGEGTGKLTGTGSSGTDHINQVNHSLGIIPVWTWDESEPEPKPEIEEETEETEEPEETDSDNEETDSDEINTDETNTDETDTDETDTDETNTDETNTDETNPVGSEPTREPVINTPADDTVTTTNNDVTDPTTTSSPNI